MTPEERAAKVIRECRSDSYGRVCRDEGEAITGGHVAIIAAVIREAEDVARAESKDLVGNLAMLVHQLVWLLRKHNPDSRAATRAADYLQRQGLDGAAIRAAAKRKRVTD
jgi:hypothetical protein